MAATRDVLRYHACMFRGIGLLFVTACHRPAVPCACEGGHGFVLAGSEDCQCVPHADAEPPPAPARTFDVGPDQEIDWDQVDAALAEGHVTISLTGARAERLEIRRTDTGPSRLTIDGGAARAVVPGAGTAYDDLPRHRVTLRRLEITGSRDKGVYWHAGDDIILEDLVIHDNKGSPAVNLEYTSRSGHASAGFTLRSSHIYSQRGECVYIGGSEGEDIDSHAAVTVENNLIHDCHLALSNKHDGINIKDRIGEATVRRNVVFHTDWGLELASPGRYTENVIFSTRGNGVHLSDQWGEGFDDVVLEDVVVVDPGDSGVYIAADTRPTDGLQISRVRVVGAPEAGITFAAGKGLRAALSGVTIAESALAFRGWGEPEVTVEGCTLADNGARADGAMREAAAGCVTEAVPPLGVLSGPDRVFFTADDPWRWANE